MLPGPIEAAVCVRQGNAAPVWDFQLESALSLQRVGVCILTKLTFLHLVSSAVMDLPGALFNSIRCVHQKTEDQINTFSLCLQAQSFNLVSSWMFLHYINIWSCSGLCFASTKLRLGCLAEM